MDQNNSAENPTSALSPEMRMAEENYLQKKRVRNRIIGLSVGLLLVIVGSVGPIAGTAKNEIPEPGLQELFNTVLYHVKNDYVEEVPSQDLMFGAIKGMLGALDDPHTRFMTPEEFNELQVETRGNFGGLGIEISMRDNILTVVTPIDDTPAMRVGLKPGDKIVEINKKSTRDLSLPDAVKQLRGAPGSSVNVSILREGEDEILYFDIVREIIRIQVVTSTYLNNNKIGYVRLKQFSQTSPQEMAKVLQEFVDKKVTGIILDMRWNPGGLLDAAHRISNFFVKEGVIVSTRGRKPELDRVFNANPRNLIVPGNIKVIILANEGSASASEIVTGALKDHKRAKFIGIKTFGKGSVQNVIPLNYQTAIALTIQKYYTPSNVSIHKKGIEPDIEVKPPEFTKDDRRYYKNIREKKLIQNFVKADTKYTPATIESFKKLVEENGYPLSTFALKRTLKEEIDRNETRPIVDLEFDNQLQRAIEELKKG
ncbi:MAG: S41 family peptidase [Leptospiraceae bacterium]|nr:S41 family peptidase [Leptospiraceae bacterium]